MSGAITFGADSWAFGPRAGTRTFGGGRWRPFGLAASVVGAIGLAAVLGFVAFVQVAGQDDAPGAVSSVTGGAGLATTSETADAAAVAPISEPLLITDLRLTDAVDAATGEPGSSTSSFGIGEPVHLWLSFEAGDAASGSLTAIWFRGEHRIARLEAPLPGSASQMVFPLPEVAVDRPGSYRVEVRSHGDQLAAESFEVTNG